VDHIDPPDGPGDPRFWDTANHQPACIHCNSVKGHKKS
jgi:5-methylcytosine-specific restriction protein A